MFLEREINKMKAKLISFFIACAGFYGTAAIADLETDRNAGACAAFFTYTENANGRMAALKMADKMDRAIQFAQTEINQTARRLKENKLDQSDWQAIIFSGNSACRKIGIRPGDFK